VCSTNARAEEHNLALLQDLPDDARTCTARDEVLPVRDGNQAFESAHISSDCARAFNQSGIPPSELVLKVGAPVYVALNLDRTEGLVKGALAIVHSMCKSLSDHRLLRTSSGPSKIGPGLICSRTACYQSSAHGKAFACSSRTPTRALASWLG
jgi:hypothetical protein